MIRNVYFIFILSHKMVKDNDYYAFMLKKHIATDDIVRFLLIYGYILPNPAYFSGLQLTYFLSILCFFFFQK